MLYVGLMKRRHLMLTESEEAALVALSEKTGLKVSELIRRAIDEYVLANSAQDATTSPS